MCGITGWVDFARDLTRERDVIDAMTLDDGVSWPGRIGRVGATACGTRSSPAGGDRPAGWRAADVGVHAARRRGDGLQR